MTSFTSLNMLRLIDANNNIVPLEHDDVTALIFKALRNSGSNDRLMALNLADKVIYRLKSWKGTENPICVNDLECMAKFVLNECGQLDAAGFVSAVCFDVAGSN